MAEDKAPSKAQLNKALDQPVGSESQRKLADKLPEKDEVQAATKAAMLAESPLDEVKEKIKVVMASPDAEDTPSGGAMIAVQGIADTIERGERYTIEKTARRHGYVPAEES